MIRSVATDDAEAICRIYNHYVLNTTVTFEEGIVTVAEMSSRIAEYTQEFPWLVYEDDGGIRGYAYVSRWKGRSAYRFSVETSVYLDLSAIGRGLGSRLYEALLVQLNATPVHAVVAGIALPNPASIALHEKFGFEKVAHFREMGRKFGRWVDMGYWELLLPEGEGKERTGM